MNFKNTLNVASFLCLSNSVYPCVVFAEQGRKTFIPTPPTYWDNSETVEIMYSSNEAGSSLK